MIAQKSSTVLSGHHRRGTCAFIGLSSQLLPHPHNFGPHIGSKLYVVGFPGMGNSRGVDRIADGDSQWVEFLKEFFTPRPDFHKTIDGNWHNWNLQV
jgi:hypothetical protein